MRYFEIGKSFHLIHQKMVGCKFISPYWLAPIECSSVNVSAWSAFGPSGWWLQGPEPPSARKDVWAAFTIEEVVCDVMSPVIILIISINFINHQGPIFHTINESWVGWNRKFTIPEMISLHGVLAWPVNIFIKLGAGLILTDWPLTTEPPPPGLTTNYLFTQVAKVITNRNKVCFPI